MLNALRASVMLLVLVGTAHAGEILVPPAPLQNPQSSAPEPTVQTPYAEAEAPEMLDGLADTALELLALLTTLL
jgi:hypothetical protein